MTFKTQIDKLEGAQNWLVWKLQIELVLEHHEVLEVVTGELEKPVTADPQTSEAQAAHKLMLKELKKKDTTARLIIIKGLNDANLQLVNTCSSASEIWEKLLAIYEQSSGQRLYRLLGQFFNYTKNSGENITTHVAKIQSVFHELNDEMQRLEKVKLPDVVLISRIMSTLPDEYFEFQSVWESIPREIRTINLLTERLRLIEGRLPVKNEEESSAFVAKTKKKSNFEKKSDKKGNSDKKIFKCFKCHKSGHYAKQCKQKSSDTKLTDSSTKESGEAFICEQARVPDSEIWLTDTGCTEHMSPDKRIFNTYTKFTVPKTVKVGNKESIVAIGYGTVIVKMLIGGKWKRNHLKVVWHVPELARNLLSVISALQKGFKFIADDKKCHFVKDNKIYIVGQTINKLYKLLMRVVMPQKSARAYMTSAAETLQLWHEHFGHQRKTHSTFPEETWDRSCDRQRILRRMHLREATSKKLRNSQE